MSLVEKIYTNFGRNVKLRRRNMFLSRAAFVRLTGLSEQTVINTEQGRTLPSLATAMIMAHTLRIGIGTLLRDPESPVTTYYLKQGCPR